MTIPMTRAEGAVSSKVITQIGQGRVRPRKTTFFGPSGASHSGQIWDHFLGWWEQRHREDVLWIFFEDLAADLRAEVLILKPSIIAMASAVSSSQLEPNPGPHSRPHSFRISPPISARRPTLIPTLAPNLNLTLPLAPLSPRGLRLDLRFDPAWQVVRIASFLQMAVDDELVDAAVRVSSFDHMAAAESRHHCA